MTIKGNNPRHLRNPGVVSAGPGAGETLVDLTDSIILNGMRVVAFRPKGGPDAIAVQLDGTVAPDHDTSISLLVLTGTNGARQLIGELEAILAEQLAWNVCTRKSPLSRRAAMKVAKRSRDTPDDRGIVEPYRCPFCSDWHVGHAPKMESLEELAAFLRARHGRPTS